MQYTNTEIALEIRQNNSVFRGFNTTDLSDDYIASEVIKQNPQLKQFQKEKDSLNKGLDSIQQFGIYTLGTLNKFANVADKTTDKTQALIFGNVVDTLGYKDAKKLEGQDYVMDLFGSLAYCLLFLGVIFFLIRKLIQPKTENKKQGKSTVLENAKIDTKIDTEFYSVSTGKIWLLSLLSVGIYPIYWFYKHVQIFKPETNSFLAALFSPFFISSLTKEIDLKYGTKVNQYSVLYILGYVLTYFVIGLPLLVYVMTLIQKEITKNNKKSDVVYPGEIWTVITGLSLVFLSFLL